MRCKDNIDEDKFMSFIMKLVYEEKIVSKFYDLTKKIRRLRRIRLIS
jgi:mannose/fructose/N-acetylgalactosamine-specific phosphotransferase system component IIB